MKTPSNFISIQNRFDSDTGILYLEDFDQSDSNKVYSIQIDSDDGILKEIKNMPDTIQGSLLFDHRSEYNYGVQAESFYGFSSCICGDLCIGCRAKSLKGLERTEVIRQAYIRSSHLRDLKYFPILSENSSVRLFGNQYPQLFYNKLINEYKSDFLYFLKKNNIEIDKRIKDEGYEELINDFLFFQFKIKDSSVELIDLL